MFCLNFALKCFKSSNLEKRMQGLSYIEESILMTKTRFVILLKPQRYKEKKLNSSSLIFIQKNLC